MPIESRREASSISTRQDWNDRPIVRVLGVVMTRNDSIGGWVPYMEGGQSKVGIHESLDGKSFRIYGWRISDKHVTLDCCIQTSMTFHDTNGTFHHWQSGNRRMGLTFYSPAEARSFDRGVRVALDKLQKVAASSGTGSCCDVTSSRSESRQSACHSPASSTGSTSSLRHHISRKSKKKSPPPTTNPPARPAKPRPTCAKQNLTQMTQSPPVCGLSVSSTAASPITGDNTTPCESSSFHFRYPITPFTTSHTYGRYFKPTTTTTLLSSSASHHREQDNKSTHTIPKTNSSILLSTKDACSRTNASTAVQHSRHSQSYHAKRITQARKNEDTFHVTGNKTSKSTKTPHLDYLEQQRDRQPTEGNSYVLFASAKPKTTLGSSESSARKNYTHPGIPSGNSRREFNSILKHSRSTYQPATIGHERFYNSRDLFEYDKVKNDSSNRLLSSPDKTGKEPHSFFNSRDNYSDNETSATSCCCFVKNPFRRNRLRKSFDNYHKEDLAERSKCIHCNEMYIHTKNKRGSCRDAPDPCLKCIEGVACMNCAKGVLNQCSQNNDVEKICTCTDASESRTGCFSRWSALSALSVILPCLCLYPPLRTCHCCAVRCHCCGGKHETSRQNSGKRRSMR